MPDTPDARAAAHPPVRSMGHDGTKTPLTPKMVRTVEALLTQEASETMESVAARAGVSRSTIYRYLRDEAFDAAFKMRVQNELRSARGKVARALVAGATRVLGTGQSAMQKVYWQLIGELKEGIEVSGPDGKPVELHASTIPLDRLSLRGKQEILAILERELGEEPAALPTWGGMAPTAGNGAAPLALLDSVYEAPPTPQKADHLPTEDEESASEGRTESAEEDDADVVYL